MYSLSFIFVLLPLPSRYRLEVKVPHRSSTLPIVPQRDIPLPIVPQRDIPLPTVTQRYTPLLTVTHRYFNVTSTLPIVTLTLLQRYSSLLQRNYTGY